MKDIAHYRHHFGFSIFLFASVAGMFTAFQDYYLLAIFFGLIQVLGINTMRTSNEEFTGSELLKIVGILFLLLVCIAFLYWVHVYNPSWLDAKRIVAWTANFFDRLVGPP